jgi:hypothetical protein
MPDGVDACYPEDNQAIATTERDGCGILVEVVSSGTCPESFKELPPVDLNDSSEPSSAVAPLAAPPWMPPLRHRLRRRQAHQASSQGELHD